MPDAPDKNGLPNPLEANESTLSRWDRVTIDGGCVRIYFRPLERDEEVAATLECEGLSFLLAKSSCYNIGRDLRSDIIIHGDPLVSRKHARIICRPGDFRIQDLGTVNGTFVNGKPVYKGKEVSLGNGDTIQIGRITRFRLRRK